MSEAALMRRIQMRASDMGDRLFRNNVGCVWIKRFFLRYGLCVGSSDLIGWKRVTITEDMVGQRVAVFYAVEVKAGTKTTKEQAHFLKEVIQAGGVGLVAHSVDDLDLAEAR